MNYCEDPLLSSLPSASFQSSSRSSDSQSAHIVKLHSRDGSGGWSPDREDRRPWLQMDLRDRLEVTAVATQGRWGSADWVSSYQLQYSDSGRTWRTYRQDNMPWSHCDALSVGNFLMEMSLHARVISVFQQSQLVTESDSHAWSDAICFMPV
ncbi:contactin-associated protein-like 5, partial [Tachysurus ichikawai]